MILQLSALLQPLLQVALQFGQQFVNRELGRDARRAQKDLLKAQARASGGASSFVQAQSPGTVSAPFVNRPPAIPVQTAGLGAAVGPLLRGLGGRVGPAVRRIAPDIAGGALGAAAVEGFLNGGVGVGAGAAFGTSFTERFVLDKASGCLRLKMPGEKGATFKIDRNGDFVRVKARRINPANKSAARRASRRIDATINFMSDLVRVSTKRDKGKTVPGGGGKVVTFRTKKRKRAC